MKINIPFSVGQRVKTKHKPPTEAIITGIILKENNFINYECSYTGSDGPTSNWLSGCELEAIDKANNLTVGFHKK